MVLGPRNEVTHPQTLRPITIAWWALVMRPAGHPPSDTPGVQASTQGTPHQQHNQGYTDKGRGTGSHPHPDPHGPTHTPPPGHSRQAHTPHTTQQTHNVRTQHNDVHNTNTNTTHKQTVTTKAEHNGFVTNRKRQVEKITQRSNRRSNTKRTIQLSALRHWIGLRIQPAT